MFEPKLVNSLFFSFFMILVVVIFANVLIAMITDNYGVISNEREAMVFWTSRLEFVAEIDVIAEGPFRKKNFIKRRKDTSKSNLSNIWDQLVNNFDDEELKFFSVEWVTYSILRLFTLVLMLIWLIVGLLSVGFLWPPQARFFLLERSQTTEVRNNKKSEQMEVLNKEVILLRDEINALMKGGNEIEEMKSEARQMRLEVKSEIDELKQIVMMLFDLHS